MFPLHDLPVVWIQCVDEGEVIALDGELWKGENLTIRGSQVRGMRSSDEWGPVAIRSEV